MAILLLTILGLPRTADAEWTVTAFFGGTRTTDSEIRLQQPAADTDVTLSPVHYAGEAFKMPIYYGYRFGFFPAGLSSEKLGGGWFGIEGEYMHLKVFADTDRLVDAEGRLDGASINGTRPLRSVIERFSISHGVNLLLVNAVVRLHARDRASDALSRWMIVGRVGAGASRPHPESTIDGVSFEQYEWGSFGMQGAAAVEVRVGGPFYATAEYKLTRTTQDVTVANGGTARTPLLTHHLAAGVTLHFHSR